MGNVSLESHVLDRNVARVFPGMTGVAFSLKSKLSINSKLSVENTHY